MKITSSNVEEIHSISEKVYEDAKKLLEHNDEFYPSGSEYGIDKGYGFHIHYVETIDELKAISDRNNIDCNETEYLEFLEDGGNTILKLNYLVSSDNFMIIYLKLN